MTFLSPTYNLTPPRLNYITFRTENLTRGKISIDFTNYNVFLT